MSTSIDSTNTSSGNSGRASLRAERRNRAAFASGRKTATPPSAWRQAFEDALRGVQVRRGRIEADRRVRGQLSVVPALLLVPPHRDHVLAEDVAEPRILEALCALDGRYARLRGGDGESGAGSGAHLTRNYETRMRLILRPLQSEAASR